MATVSQQKRGTKMEQVDRQRYMAATVIDQIRQSNDGKGHSGVVCMMSWAAEQFCALPETEDMRGGVAFKVNGYKLKGTVSVELTWADVYRVKFFKGIGKPA